jgi:hypothetical protein
MQDALDENPICTQPVENSMFEHGQAAQAWPKLGAVSSEKWVFPESAKARPHSASVLPGLIRPLGSGRVLCNFLKVAFGNG